LRLLLPLFLPFFAPRLPGRAFLFLTSAARQERLNGADRTERRRARRSSERQARPVTKWFLNFGAQSALARRDGPKRLSGGNDGDRRSGRKLRQPPCSSFFLVGTKTLYQESCWQRHQT
jgi:hypothetical protein